MSYQRIFPFPVLHGHFFPAGKPPPPPPVVRTPYWLTVGAFVAENDPNWPLKSKSMQKSCTHEYGTGTITTLTLKWSYSAGWFVVASCSADIDGDGVIEVIFCSADEYIYCVNGLDGTLKWRYLTGGFVRYATAYDIDGDGLMEVIVTCADFYA